MKEINLYNSSQKGTISRETAQITKLAARIESTIENGQAPNKRRSELRLEEMQRYLEVLDGSKPYEHIFEGASNAIRCYGDVSPSMALLDTNHYGKILAENPDTKFIVCFRDPTERLFSAFRMAVAARGGIDNVANPVKILNHLMKGNKDMGSVCEYDRTITQMEAVIPDNNILYLFYENIFSANSSQETDKIKQFLSLPDLNFDTTEIVNPTEKKREIDNVITDHIVKWARKGLSQQYAYMSEKFQNELPDSWASNASVKRTATA